MAKFVFEVNTDNAAFGDTDTDKRAEVVRLLRETAEQIENGGSIETFRVRDNNGNRVGYATFVEE